MKQVFHYLEEKLDRFFTPYLTGRKSVVFNLNTPSLSSVAVLSFILALFLIALTVLGFFTNFDITDEGFHYYLHQHGLDIKTTYVQYHIFTNIIGKLFNHTVIGYRLLTLATLILTAFYSIYATKKFMFEGDEWNAKALITFSSIVIIFSLCFFVWIPSFEYNFITVITASIWFSSILLLIASQSFTYIFIASLAIVFGISAKFTYGIPLLLMTPIILFVSKKFLSIDLSIKHVLLSFLLPMLFLAIIAASLHYIDGKHWSYTLNSINFYASNSGESSGIFHLCWKYLRDTYKFLLKFISSPTGIIFLLLLLFYKYFAKKEKQFGAKVTLPLFNIAKILAVILITCTIFIPFKFKGDINYFYNSLNLIARLVLASIVLIISLLTVNNKHKRLIAFTIIGFLGALMTPIGTGINYIQSLSINTIIFSSLVATFLYHYTKGFKTQKTFLITCLLALFCISSVIIARQQLIYGYRSDSYVKQTTHSQYSPYLKHVKIEDSLAKQIDTLWMTLEDLKFDRENDRIIAHVDIPGFLSAVGAKAFGEPWIFTSYDLAVKRACLYINQEPISKTRYIYILSADHRELDLDIQKCINSKIKPSKEIQEYNIGYGHHYTYRNDYNLILKGPYILK